MGLHIFFKKGHEKHIDNLLKEFIKSFKLKLDGDKFRVSNQIGFINKNEGEDAKIYGNLELDLFEDKFNEPKSFFDLVREKIISKNELDLLFDKYKEHLLKVYIDIEGDGDPLDILYEYNFDGRKIINHLVKALELLSEEDDDLAELYEKVRGMERNFLSSRIWEHQSAKNKIFHLASNSGVIAQEGSIKIYAENKKDIEKYYKSMIKEILEPLFEESFDDKLKKVFG